MTQRLTGGDSNAEYVTVTGDKAGFTVTILESKDSLLSTFEKLPTKVKRGRSVGKKMVASFFGMTDMVTREEKYIFYGGWSSRKDE
ncbi:hypothetical protein EVAR_91608_1 [Eumeta japonica]|uniref:Uncharacterized protein n=1 Tax=Eumeta variegata TaxID=151549 RepID=A0A4C1UXY3_EUMVA|nr:hypothetical protein EVAR_91608_1 [Eumeta japonica]